MTISKKIISGVLAVAFSLGLSAYNSNISFAKNIYPKASYVSEKSGKRENQNFDNDAVIIQRKYNHNERRRSTNQESVFKKILKGLGITVAIGSVVTLIVLSIRSISGKGELDNTTMNNIMASSMMAHTFYNF